MSAVDTRFSASERAALLAEVQSHLPAFLSGLAAERPDPVGDVSALLGLHPADLQRVTATHIALTSEVRSFVAALREGLRNPLTTSIRPKVVSQAIRGGIDWGATVRHRAGAGASGATLFVVRPARRVFDTPENRALAYALEQLDLSLRRVAPASSDERTGVHDKSWFGDIVANAARVRDARRHHWLRDVPAERPDARTRRRLRAARTSFYRVRIPEVIDLLERYSNPSPEDLTDLLSQRYFEPQRDWLLFEVTIALRVARVFAERSATKRKSRLLVGTGRSAYARYGMPDGAEVRLWYQAWPSDAGASAHSDARDRYSIAAGPARPDFIVQRRSNGASADAVLLEVKASKDAKYLGAGLMQLLGYLHDRPSLFQKAPGGWLVAPASSAFETADSDGTTLWAVDSDEVSEAVAKRFGYLAP